jgi:hypothetical protein
VIPGKVVENSPDTLAIDFGAREDVAECPHCQGPCCANKWKGVKRVRKNTVQSYKHDLLLSLHQLVSHITHHSLRIARMRAADDEHENTVKMLRVNYILGDLSKEDLASQVYAIEHKKEQQVELLHIYELLSVVGIELFTNLANDTKQGIEYTLELNQQIKNFKTLCEYSNEQFANISISYHVKVDQIDVEGWEMKQQKFSIRSARKGMENMPKAAAKTPAKTPAKAAAKAAAKTAAKA